MGSNTTSWIHSDIQFNLVPPGVPKDVLTQKSTNWNPGASVRRVTENQPSVPVSLTI